MHLLLAQKGSIGDEGEAVDLGQSPGDLCVLSAADTELAALAAAHRARGGETALRLVNLMQLRHEMSVDSWIERTGRHARLVVARLLGGQSYWRYVAEALRAAADAHGFALALVPGDDRPDPGLAPFCTVAPQDCDALWAFLREGGADNARGFLDACDDLIAGRPIEGAASPLLKAGVLEIPASVPDGTSPPQGGRGERANDDLLIIVRKVEALQKLLDSETGANLRVGTERALNILAAEEKKDGAGAFDGPVDRSLLSEPAERELAHVIEAVGGHVDDHVAREDYEGAFAALAELRPAVDAFFDHVMVNADDAAVRANRLALLAGLRAVTRKLADFSKIAG